MLVNHQLDLLKRSGMIEPDLPEQPEHEILRYLLKNNYFTAELDRGNLRQTYARITREPAKIVILEEKKPNTAKAHNLLYILKVNNEGDLMLHSLTESSQKGMVEYEHGYPHIRLPHTDAPVNWTYFFHDIQVYCTSEFCKTTFEGKEHDALMVKRLHKAARNNTPQKFYVEKEIYVSGYGILCKECSQVDGNQK